MKNMARLARKHETARALVPQPVVDQVEGAEVAIIAYGSADTAVEEARWRLASQHQLPTSYLRLRALPLAESVKDFVAAHRRVYVVELNTDAQMLQLLTLHLAPDLAGRLRAANWGDGLPLTARWLTNTVMDKENAK